MRDTSGILDGKVARKNLSDASAKRADLRAIDAVRDGDLGALRGDAVTLRDGTNRAVSCVDGKSFAQEERGSEAHWRDWG